MRTRRHLLFLFFVALFVSTYAIAQDSDSCEGVDGIEECFTKECAELQEEPTEGDVLFCYEVGHGVWANAVLKETNKGLSELIPQKSYNKDKPGEPKAYTNGNKKIRFFVLGKNKLFLEELVRNDESSRYIDRPVVELKTTIVKYIQRDKDDLGIDFEPFGNLARIGGQALTGSSMFALNDGIYSESISGDLNMAISAIAAHHDGTAIFETTIDLVDLDNDETSTGPTTWINTLISSSMEESAHGRTAGVFFEGNPEINWHTKCEDEASPASASHKKVNSVIFDNGAAISYTEPHEQSLIMAEYQPVLSRSERSRLYKELDNRLFCDGNIYIINGINKSSSSESESGVPVLKDIPGVGRAFSKKVRSEEYEHIFVIIRIKIYENFQEMLAKGKKVYEADETEEKLLKIYKSADIKFYGMRPILYFSEYDDELDYTPLRLTVERLFWRNWPKKWKKNTRTIKTFLQKEIDLSKLFIGFFEPNIDYRITFYQGMEAHQIIFKTNDKTKS